MKYLNLLSAALLISAVACTEEELADNLSNNSVTSEPQLDKSYFQNYLEALHQKQRNLLHQTHHGVLPGISRAGEVVFPHFPELLHRHLIHSPFILGKRYRLLMNPSNFRSLISSNV